MANTVIKLKKSSVPAEVPSTLEYGELAINYADGMLYYKNSTGQIVGFSAAANVYSFATINANNSLITALSNNSVLTINPGNNIEISGDIVNDIVTIAANLKPAFDKANSANVLAYNTGIGANAYAVVVGFSGNNYANLVGDSANNYAGTMANAANAYAASLTPDLSAVFVVANNAYNTANAAYGNANSILSVAQAAFDRANSSNDVLYVAAAYLQANDAYAVANAAFDKANTGISIANANAFSVISVSGQSNIVASINDTLTLAGANGINISTDAATKTVTIIAAAALNFTDYGSIVGPITTTQNYGSL